MTTHIEQSSSSALKPRKRHFNRLRRSGSFLNESEPVTIDSLLPWNSNQSFYGKIVSIQADVPQDSSKRTVLEGQVGDSTGVVNFKTLYKRDHPVPEVGQVLLFTKAMNKGTQEGKHIVEIKRFGSIAIVDNHPINKVNTANNVSERALPERPPRPERAPREPKEPQAEKKDPSQPKEPRQRQPRQPRVPQEPLVAGEPVKINQLIMRNNQQSIIGKILSIAEEKRTLKSTGEEQVYLVGEIADETGAVKYNVLKKDEVAFKTNDVVQLDLVMNKLYSGNHVVQVSRLGSYTVLNNYKLSKVNTEIVTPIPAPVREKKAPVQENKQQTQHNSRIASDSQPQQRRSNNNENNSNNNRSNYNNSTNARVSNPRHNTNENRSSGNNNNNNNSQGRSTHTHNNSSGNSNSTNSQVRGNTIRNSGRHNNSNGNSTTQNQPRSSNSNNNRSSVNSSHPPRNNYVQKNDRPPRNSDEEIKTIKDLMPGTQGQTIRGLVYQVMETSKTLNGKEVVSLKGRIADRSANINFELALRSEPIRAGQTYIFSNIMNKVGDDSFHFITIGKFGSYSLAHHALHNANKNEGEDNNLSSIAYEKKQVPLN